MQRHGDATRFEKFKRDGLRGRGPNAFMALLLDSGMDPYTARGRSAYGSIVLGLGSEFLFQDAKGPDKSCLTD